MAEGIHGHSDTGYFTELQAVDVNEGEVDSILKNAYSSLSSAEMCIRDSPGAMQTKNREGGNLEEGGECLHAAGDLLRPCSLQIA